MQQKFAEVEAANSTIFFGPAHARALEDLRGAQVALAQAWVTSSSSGTGGAAAEEIDEGGEGEGEGEDGLLARKRRVRNDAQFEAVADGIKDVAAKLQMVAVAMAEVDRESRGVWGGYEDGGGVRVDETRSGSEGGEA
jgi:hypothetical protein